MADAARLIGRSTEATKKPIERHDVEKIVDANGYTFRVHTSDVLRVANEE